MSAEVELYLDDDGRPRARGGLAARFLETDLQADAALAGELLRRLDRAAVGESNELIANAHCLELGPEQVRIEPLFDPTAAPVDLPLEELRDLVSAWCALLEGSGAD